MDILQNPQKILEDWRTDDFINKQYLCSDLRRCNTMSNFYILKYNINDYDWHAEQLSITDTKENIIRLKTYLNKNKELVDLIERQCEIELDIDLSKKKQSFRLIYNFHRKADTKKLQRKKAIVLETFSYEEFRNLVQYVGYGDFEKKQSYDYLGYFTKVYEFYYRQASTPEQLIFLYTDTPDFVFEKIDLGNDMLMQHLFTLTEYDDTGFFSGWRDGSSALVNILKALSSGYMMNTFNKNPELCNRIYFNLDGVSYEDGKPQSNRIIYAGIMRAFAQNHKIQQNAPIFKIGKGHRVNTKMMELSGGIWGFGKSDEKTFFLQQEKLANVKPAIVPKEGNPNKTDEEYIPTSEGRQFLPLEMVYLEEDFDGVTTIAKVPAIYVKALADAEEWQIINDKLRITADIAAIVLGVGTLATTGNPYFILAAAADLSLAIPDLTIQAFREEIKKIQGGEKFLRDWDLIYSVGGAIVATPQLIVSVYRGVFVLLPKATENVQQGLKASAISLFLDLNAGRFERSQLKFLETKEWVRASDGFFNEFSSEALLKNGAFFLEKVDDNKLLKEYALVYKGKIVVEGNKFDKVYQETLLSLKRVSYDADKVKSILEIKLLTKNKGELNLFHGTTPSAVASIHKEGVLLSANKVELDFNTKGKGAFYTSSSYKETLGYNKYKFGSRGLESDIVYFDIPEEEILKLKIKVFDIPTQEWAEFVTKSRTGKLVHDYDVVIGPKLKNPRQMKFEKDLPKAHKEFQIAFTSEKGIKILTKYLKK